ncbi:hypothetical protein [Candidatus Hodarchaeum mangrovi]
MSRISSARYQFFEMMAEFWQEYGLPGTCGYIDALLWLEPQEWSQNAISDRLKELLANKNQYPVSISSINRAIKINVYYGTVIKEGSHKIGYIYRVATDSDMFTGFFQRFINLNSIMIEKLRTIETLEMKDEDPNLKKAIDVQIKGLEMYSQFLEYGLSFMKEKEKVIGNSREE